jgi:hypothetical protein
MATKFQMRAFQVRPQTLLIKSFRSFVVVGGAHDHNLGPERDEIHSNTSADIQPRAVDKGKGVGS